jgi:hypothetical protein
MRVFVPGGEEEDAPTRPCEETFVLGSDSNRYKCLTFVPVVAPPGTNVREMKPDTKNIDLRYSTISLIFSRTHPHAPCIVVLSTYLDSPT